MSLCHISHPCYYILEKLCEDNYNIEKSIADMLNISRSRLWQKISGLDDFTDYEAKAVGELLNRNLEDIFLI